MRKLTVPTTLVKMPHHIMTAADHFAEFITMDVPFIILEHAANILRRRIDIVLDLARQCEVDKSANASTLDPTQESTSCPTNQPTGSPSPLNEPKHVPE